MRRPRSSIASLMGIVLVAAVGLGALHSPSAAWAGAVFLTTYAVLGLGIVGALHGRGARRAWWVGFSVFGCGYLAMVMVFCSHGMALQQLPTSQILLAIRPTMVQPTGIPRAPAWGRVTPGQYYLNIGHSLWTLVAAVSGGTLARLLLVPTPDQPEEPEPPARRPSPTRRWMPAAVVGGFALVVIGAVAAVRAGPDGEAAAGTTFFLTCGLLGAAGLVAAFGRGRRRMAGTGAVLLGAGYLFLVFARAPYQLLPPGQVQSLRSLYQPLPTSSLLNGIRPWTAALVGGRAAADARLLGALEQPVEMTFPDPTPLEDVLRYVTMATATPGYPGVPIYLDPIALLEQEKTPKSPITIDLRGVPLRTSLRLALNQLGLDYGVLDGCLRVISQQKDPGELDSPYLVAYHERWKEPDSTQIATDIEDPYMIVGHCLLALLAAGFGAVAAPMLAEWGREPADPPRTDGRIDPGLESRR